MATWAYFDTSCLVKLLVAEPESDMCRRGYRVADRVGTSVISLAEARVAIARKLTAGEITPAAARSVIDSLEHTLVPDMALVPISDALSPVFREISRLAATYPLLRTLDAIQLASGVVLRNRSRLPQIDFFCWDKRLRNAAKGEGFNVLPLVAGVP